MRAEATAERTLALLTELGRATRGARLYLTGGASAVLVGWRERTVGGDAGRMTRARDFPQHDVPAAGVGAGELALVDRWPLRVLARRVAAAAAGEREQREACGECAPRHGTSMASRSTGPGSPSAGRAGAVRASGICGWGGGGATRR